MRLAHRKNQQSVHYKDYAHSVINSKRKVRLTQQILDSVAKFSEEIADEDRRLLFAVGDPDVFDLGGVLEEEAVGGRGGVEPLDVAGFVGEDLFEISDRKSFCGGAGGRVGEDPEGIDVVVFG